MRFGMVGLHGHVLEESIIKSVELWRRDWRPWVSIYNGTSLWADYWTQTVKELHEDLIGSGELNNTLVDTFLGHCADPAWWTQTIAFTAVHGYAPVY